MAKRKRTKKTKKPEVEEKQEVEEEAPEVEETKEEVPEITEEQVEEAKKIVEGMRLVYITCRRCRSTTAYRVGKAVDTAALECGNPACSVRNEDVNVSAIREE